MNDTYFQMEQFANERVAQYRAEAQKASQVQQAKTESRTFRQSIGHSLINIGQKVAGETALKSVQIHN